MTVTNPSPFANPFNQSRHLPASRFLKNPSKLAVPESSPFGSNFSRSSSSQLTVPNQDVPYVNGPVPAAMFLRDSSLFQLTDGSVIDLKTHKIVFDPNIQFKAKGYWSDPNSNIDKHGDNSWGKTESVDEIMARCMSGDEVLDPNLSPESIRYWKKAKEESKKLEQNLTDEQKKLLADLQSEKFFPLTKLEEEK